MALWRGPTELRRYRRCVCRVRSSRTLAQAGDARTARSLHHSNAGSMHPIRSSRRHRTWPDARPCCGSAADVIQGPVVVQVVDRDFRWIAINRAAADVVRAEAQSEHWLAACWRPILMLTFGALIVARWLGYSAPGISESEILALWGIVQLGLGGYVIGRSAEKIVPSVAAAMSGKAAT